MHQNLAVNCVTSKSVLYYWSLNDLGDSQVELGLVMMLGQVDVTHEGQVVFGGSEVRVFSRLRHGDHLLKLFTGDLFRPLCCVRYKDDLLKGDPKPLQQDGHVVRLRR